MGSITRNAFHETGIPLMAAGDLLYYVSDATGSTGNAMRAWQIDAAPSATLSFDKVSFGPGIPLDLTDPTATTLTNCGLAQMLFLRSSFGNLTMNNVVIGSACDNRQYSGYRITNVLGNVSITNCSGFGKVSDASGNNPAVFTMQNVPSCTAFSNFESYVFRNVRSTFGVWMDTVSFSSGVTPSNIYLIGGQLTLTGMANQEWEGLYVANMTDGTVQSFTNYQALSMNRLNSVVFRKFRPVGSAKLPANQITAGDSFSQNVYVHDLDFSAANNATSTTGLCSNSGTSFLTIANAKMGTTASALTNNLNRGTSNLVEKNVTYSNVTAGTIGSLGDNQGIPYSNNFRAEYVMAAQTYFRSAPTTNLPNPSYKDCANWYTLIDTTKATGRLCLGAFGGQSSLSLYDFTGTAYTNNGGLAYFEGAGDTIVFKCPYAIKSVTSFKNIPPIIHDGRNSYTTSATSNSVGTGSKTWTVGSGLSYVAGDTIVIARTSDATQLMWGTVNSYASTTLTVDVTGSQGSGTFTDWIFKSPYQTEATYEFRYVQWGSDVTAASWQALTAANLAAVTVTDSNVGINMQLRVTGVGALTGRYLQQVLFFTNNDASYNPPVTYFNVTATGTQTGSTYALYDTSSGVSLIGSVTTTTSGSIAAPAALYGVTTPVRLRVRLYGYLPYQSTSSYYNANVSVSTPQTADSGITQANVATVAAYTTLETLDKLYDYIRYYESVNVSQDQIATKAGSSIDLGSYNLVVNATAGSVFTVVGSTITIKASTLTAGSTFTSFVTSGTVSTANGALIQVTYTDNTGLKTYATWSISGFTTGSRVLLKNVTTNTVVYNSIVSGTSVSASYTNGTTFSTGDSYLVRITWVSGTSAHLPEQYTGSASSTGLTVIDDSAADSVYNTNAIDGSLVTKFSADYINDQVDLAVAADFSAAEFYAWWVYNLTTSQGITDFFGGVTAIDAGNYRINTATVNVMFDNLTTSNRKQSDSARIYRDDDAYPVYDPTTGGGGIDLNWRNPVYVVNGSGGGATAADVWSYSSRTLTSGGSVDPVAVANAVWGQDMTTLTAGNNAGQKLKRIPESIGLVAPQALSDQEIDRIKAAIRSEPVPAPSTPVIDTQKLHGEISNAVLAASAKASYVAKLEKELEDAKKAADARAKEIQSIKSEQAALAELEMILPAILPKPKKYRVKVPKPVAVRK
jgi:hypothetical protein